MARVAKPGCLLLCMVFLSKDAFIDVLLDPWYIEYDARLLQGPMQGYKWVMRRPHDIQEGFRITMLLSLMKNCTEHWSEPQITGSKPASCLRVMSPRVPQSGHESTAQYGSSFSPTRPAFSRTKIVPGCICSGIHSFRTFSSPTIVPPVEPNSPAMKFFCRDARNRMPPARLHYLFFRRCEPPPALVEPHRRDK